MIQWHSSQSAHLPHQDQQFKSDHGHPHSPSFRRGVAHPSWSWGRKGAWTDHSIFQCATTWRKTLPLKTSNLKCCHNMTGLHHLWPESNMFPSSPHQQDNCIFQNSCHQETKKNNNHQLTKNMQYIKYTTFSAIFKYIHKYFCAQTFESFKTMHLKKAFYYLLLWTAKQ